MRIRSSLWLPQVVARICVFLFVFQLLLGSLYFLGNFQGFLESTQLMLLRVLEIVSLLFLVTAVYFWVFIIFAGIRWRFFMVVEGVLMVLGMTLSSALLFIIKFVGVWFTGYG